MRKEKFWLSIKSTERRMDKDLGNNKMSKDNGTPLELQD